jgi:hypothetical protein
MQEFFSRYAFDQFAPVADRRVVSSGFALYDGQRRVLVFKPRKTYRMDLRGFKDVKEITVSWFDPTTGIYSDPVRMGKRRHFVLRSPWNDVFSIACIELQ